MADQKRCWICGRTEEDLKDYEGCQIRDANSITWAVNICDVCRELMVAVAVDSEIMEARKDDIREIVQEVLRKAIV